MGGLTGGGSSPSTQTVVQQQQIPQYLQQFTQENQDVARDIASRPFPTYQGQRIADFTPMQQQSFGLIQDAANNPTGPAANNEALTAALYQMQGGSGFQPFSGQANAGSYLNTAGPTRAGSFLNGQGGYFNPQMYGGQLDPSQVAPWMSQYVEQALQPQLQDINRQSSLNAQGINAGATAAGAFGDARNGVQLAENQRNTDQLRSNAIGTGYQNAFNTAVGAAQNAFGQNTGAFFQNQANRLSGYQTNAGQFNTEDAAQRAAWAANAGQFNTEDAAQRAAVAENAGINQQNNAGRLANGQFILNAAQSIPQMLAAQYGLTEQQAQDLQQSGQTQQQQTQQGLSTSYQDFLNQFEYPQEMLNLRLATASNQPYGTTRLTTTPYSSTAQSIGGLASLFGLAGRSGLFGGSGSA